MGLEDLIAAARPYVSSVLSKPGMFARLPFRGSLPATAYSSLAFLKQAQSHDALHNMGYSDEEIKRMISTGETPPPASTSFDQRFHAVDPAATKVYSPTEFNPMDAMAPPAPTPPPGGSPPPQAPPAPPQPPQASYATSGPLTPPPSGLQQPGVPQGSFQDPLTTDGRYGDGGRLAAKFFALLKGNG